MVERDVNQVPAANELKQAPESNESEGKPWRQPQLKILDARQTMSGLNFLNDGPGYS